MENKTKNTTAGLILAIICLTATANAQIGGNTAAPTDMIGGNTMNPSAVYCTGLGYQYEIVRTPEGEDGICKFSETASAPAWSFMQGKESVEYSYCSKMGYKYKRITDPEKCSKYYTNECLVCILPDETEVETNELMKTEKGKPMPTTTLTQPTTTTPAKPVCGNGACEAGETESGCPQDCGSKTSPLAYAAAAIAILVIIALVISKTKKKY